VKRGAVIGKTHEGGWGEGNRENLMNS